MTLPPACAEIRPLLADHLDGLVERADAERVDAHLAACAACAAAAERAGRLQGALRAPWEIAEAPADLPQRARDACARSAAPPARAVSLLRYAATFAAGVLVTLLVVRPESAPTSVPPAVAVAPAPESTVSASPDAVAVSDTPRRIR